jgi:hypothetical protein
MAMSAINRTSTLAIDENAVCDGENGPRATCGGSKAQVAEATTTDRPTFSYQQRHLLSRTPTRRPGIVGSNNRRNVQHSGWRVGVVAAEDCEPLNNREGLGDRLGEPSADIEENVV